MYKKNISSLSTIIIFNLLCTITQSLQASADYLTTITTVATDGSQPYLGVYSPDNKWFATANYISCSITIFDVDATTGQMAQIQNSPFSGGGLGDAYPLTYSPIIEGKYYLAAANYTGDQVVTYSVDSTSGQITEIGSYAIGYEPNSVAYSPNGQWLAVANYGDPDGGSITVYSVDPSSGTLNSGSTFNYLDITGLNAPGAALYSADNRYIAILNYGDGKIIVCPVDQNTGALGTALPPVATGTASSNTFLAYSPDGKWLAATGYEPVVYVFAANANGTLTPVAGSPFATTAEPYVPTYSPDSTHLAVTCSDNMVRAFSVNANGALTEVAAANTGSYPWNVTYSPNGLWLAVTNVDDADVSVFAVTPSTPGATPFVTRLIQKYGKA